MMLRRLGNTDVSIPVIGQGTWRMGEDQGMASAEVAALRLGIQLGLTLIDTAEMYADGGAERITAQAIADCRDQVFLVSKVLPSNATYDGTLKAADRSLKRLGTDWLDLYLLHWPSERVPVSETMRALERLVDEGRIRFLGISNFDAEGTAEVQSVLQSHPLVCNQVLYHLQERGVEHSLLPHCEEHGITMMAYSPLGQGEFPQPGSPGRQVLDEIGRRYDKTPYQVALNFLTRRESVVAIPKAGSPEHVRENAAAVGWELDAEDARKIDAAFPAPDGETSLAVL